MQIYAFTFYTILFTFTFYTFHNLKETMAILMETFPLTQLPSSTWDSVTALNLYTKPIPVSVVQNTQHIPPFKIKISGFLTTTIYNV